MKNREASRELLKKILEDTNTDLVAALTFETHELERDGQPPATPNKLPLREILSFFMTDVYERLEKLENDR